MSKIVIISEAHLKVLLKSVQNGTEEVSKKEITPDIVREWTYEMAMAVIERENVEITFKK